MKRFILAAAAAVVVVVSAAVGIVHAGGDPADVQATILKYESDIKPEGSYNWEYATSNRLAAEESGVGSSYASGKYAYVSPEGVPIELQYTADELGFRPQGDHLPTPPPIPDYILKSLKYIEDHPFEKLVVAKRK